jgi:uncharacterized protein (DUF2345 family)
MTPEDQNQYFRQTEAGPEILAPRLAEVVGYIDSKYTGTLEVDLMTSVGNVPRTTGSVISVRYLSPFYGTTPIAGNSNTFNDTQKSYGMWMVPPDPGTKVLVIFVGEQGFWIGSVQDEFMNFMVPGLAATETNVGTPNERRVVAEFNKKDEGLIPQVDATLNKKPVHPFDKVIETQGLLKDDIRGITTSSARREVPSAVFGISTPGPLDKTGPTGVVGKTSTKTTSVHLSRLGGTTFVMDDGDDKFIRKTKPSDGPPEYASLEDEEQGGIKDIPHNELVRIRTRTGHQILMHNSEDLIYIGNARGTSWVEMTSDGKIDIYAEDSVSIRTKKDFNFYADRDINLEAGRNVNIKSNENMITNVGGNHTLMVTKDQKIKVDGAASLTISKDKIDTIEGKYDLKVTQDISQTTDAGLNFNAGKSILNTAGAAIGLGASAAVTLSGSIVNLNGPKAPTAPTATVAELPVALTVHSLPDLDSANSAVKTKTTIMARMPTAEPYPQHENLDPQGFKPDKTDREGKGPGSVPPGRYKRYSTNTDTFKKIGKPAQ